MLRESILLISTLSFFGTVTAQNVKNQNPTNPVPQIEAGKVKNLSVESLPPELKRVTEGDIRRAAKEKKLDGRFVIMDELSEEEVVSRKNYYGRTKDIVELKGKTKSNLSDISAGDFSRYQFEGVVPEGPTIEGPWSSFQRIYKRPDGVLVTLHEWDYVADGGGIITVKELMNTSVNRHPAQFSIMRSPSGEILSELRWATNRKAFSITVWDEVSNAEDRQYNFKWLIGLAESIR